MNVKSFIPTPLIPPLRACRDYLRRRLPRVPGYSDRYQKELEHFSKVEQVPELPPITTYWVDRHLYPMLQPLGFSNCIELFRGYIGRVCRATAGSSVQILSVGSGDAATEINIARWLLENEVPKLCI